MNSTNSFNPFRLKALITVVFCTAGIAVFWAPLYNLAVLSLDDELYSYIGLIPLFSLAIILLKRRDIFSQVYFSPAIGAAVVLTGLALLLVGTAFKPDLGDKDFLSLSTSGFVLWAIGFFIGLYGQHAFKKAMFPLLFLFFLVPVPADVLDRCVRFLQLMTADAVDGIFGLIGLTYLRTGMVFELPNVAIEVAEQCSGIRSSLSLVVATTAAGYVFLETRWRRFILVLAIIPITIFKNALRITTLTLMAAYVDPAWLTDSWLHRAGGKPFFFIALLLWSPILWLLWRSEKKRVKGARREVMKKGV
jgi:exosortase